ncbi:type VI secretion system tube protein Hcp [Roseomonas sp. PWR1]|uniref:Type VI secretion system tube protein Hcp n=1 Tax=Roseomonas nitratireducens TaxID=2820810 RepID=A0ABS4B156_9PROT|nr:type VI secretion system tube protein Hcp [Neoroseomonas nitratireducens]MBP0466766.1 type VI secretion system tube protein Hcp [Neoroseomonas nitratireducens]
MPVLMQMPGVTGESTIAGYEGWLELKRFAWGGTRPYRGEGAGGARTTRVLGAQLRNVTAARLVDSSSGAIWLAMIGFTTLTPVKFVWLRTGSDQLVKYFSSTLIGARITSISETSGGDRPLEQIELLYQEIEFATSDVGDDLSGVQDIVSYKIGAHSA